MDEPTVPLAGLSPISGKRLDARFDGGQLSSDDGVVLLREIEQRLRVADRLAACIKDPRAGSDHTKPCPYSIHVQVGARSCPFRPRTVLATDHFASGKPARYPGPLCAWAVLWRSVVRQLSYGSQARHLWTPLKKQTVSSGIGGSRMLPSVRPVDAV